MKTLKRTNIGELKHVCDFPQSIPKTGKSFNLRTETEKEMQWKIIDRTRESWMVSITNAVKARLNDELALLMESASNALTPDTFMISVIDDIGSRDNKAAWGELIKNIFLPVGRDLADRTIGDIQKQRSARLDVKELEPAAEFFVDAEILNYLEEAEGFKTDLILETTKRRIGEEFAAGVLAGEGIPELTARIRRRYAEEFTKARATMIARTEVIQASNFGALSGAKSLGIPGLRSVWLSTRDIRTRSSHFAEDGDTADIDGFFTLSTGSRLRFPGDGSLGAPASDVVNCRCTLFFEGE